MPHIEKQIIVLNKNGFCLRPAALFVDLVNQFKSTVTVVKDKTRVNGKSILALLTLHAKYQTSLRLIVDGDDAETAAAEFEKFFIKERDKTYPGSTVTNIVIFICIFLFLLLIQFLMS